MRTRLRLALAAGAAMSISGCLDSASAQEAVPTPKPNPFRTAAPASKPSKSAPSANRDDTAAGFWQDADEEGRPQAWFYFTEKDGVYNGRIVRMFKKPGDPDTPPTCQKCTGDQKGAPMLGLQIVTGMKRNGGSYTDGSILDPRDGSVYHAQMELSADGKELSVRGYLGIPMLGQTQIWTHLPDDAIAPEDIPKESHSPDATQD
jgi:uncharacterized protein (DUF2147 family)